MAHTCHATGCTKEVPPEMFMCNRHWMSLPQPMKNRIWATYRHGQCDDWKISHAYADAARAAVTFIAEKEGVTPDVAVYDMLDPTRGKLDVYQFGRKLLETNDLDPVYVLLWNSGLDNLTLKKWLLSYWCFYHVGTASWCVDCPYLSENYYWSRMMTAARSKDYPRCHERRHFRGENAKKSVAYLRKRGIEDLFDPFSEPKLDGTPWNATQVIGTVQEWVGFGPWISFKVADMLERLNLLDVKFSREVTMYDSPRDGAIMLWEVEHGVGAKPGEAERYAIHSILEQLGDFDAPPRYERKISLQEIETVLCKWKSYMGGHYEIGEDVRGCREGLLKFGKCRTSQRLLKAGKVGGLW